MSLETMTKLATTTVGVGGVASVTFSGIPQGYTDLKVVSSVRSTSGAAVAYSMVMRINNLTTSIYSQRALEGSGSAASSFSQSGVDTAVRASIITGTGATTSTFSNSEIYIPNYAGFTNKSVLIDTVAETNATTQYMNMIAYLVSSPEPVISLTFTAESAASSFAQHSTFTLYGVKNMAQTAGNSIKATGGNIVFDGTYVYHVFNATSSFTPTQPLLADCLVVAGGGGSGYYYAGGGGAGGIQYAASQSLITAGYTVTVGAGGATKSSGSAGLGATGGDSSFSSLVIAKGGGAGNGIVTGSAAGGAGGSGGGAGGPAAGSAGGAAVAGTGGTFYGNAGGPTPGGGSGGGSGAAGTSKGKGGDGTTAFSSWGIATGTGQNVGGVFYYAGGGESNQSAGGGGYGGGGAWLNSGTPNTGGGAGADQGSGGGGSGIVIVRYKG
jgi:hypothetical protein